MDNDCWFSVYSHCDNLSRAMLRGVNKYFNSLTKKECKARTLQVAVRNKEAGLVWYCRDYEPDEQICDRLSALSDIKLIDYFLRKGCEISHRGFVEAVKTQDLSYVKRFIDKGFPFIEKGLYISSDLSSLDIFYYLFKNLFDEDRRHITFCYRKVKSIERLDLLYKKYKMKPDKMTLDKSVWNYDLFMHLITQYKLEPDGYTLQAALTKGDIEVFKYLIPIIPDTLQSKENMIRIAASRSNEKFKVLLDEGYPVNEYTIRTLAKFRNLELLELVKDKLITVSYPGTDFHLPVAQFFYDNGILPNGWMYSSALARKSEKMVVWIESVNPNSQSLYNENIFIRYALLNDNIDLLHVKPLNGVNYVASSIRGCQWIIDNGGVINNETLEIAIEDNNLEFIDYLLEKDVNVTRYCLYPAIKKRNWNFLRRFKNELLTGRHLTRFVKKAPLSVIKEIITSKQEIGLELLLVGNLQFAEYAKSLGYEPTEVDMRIIMNARKYKIMKLFMQA